MILLSAGHRPEAPGACYNGFCEHEEAVKWVDILATLLQSRESVAVVPTGSLTSKINFINTYPKIVELVIEIHFNSDGARAGRGSETLYCPGSVKGLYAARILQDSISALLTPNRGAKEGWHRMDRPGHEDYVGDVDGDERIDAFLFQTKPVALIVEPEFVHNRLVIVSLRQVVCEVMADAIVEIMKSMRGE